MNLFKRFDMRDRIRRGVTLLTKINKLKPKPGLIVGGPFFPSPLTKLPLVPGFASRVRRGTGSDWLVYFWREPA